MSQIALNPNELTLIREILRTYVPECEVRAFGSRVRGVVHESSDLDLVVMTAAPLDILRLADLREAFSESDLPFRVDVLDWAETSEGFRRIIEQVNEVIREADEAVPIK